MNAERLRTFVLTLPHVVETAQWGGIVFWVGDKAIGGKMFAMMNPDGGGPPSSLAVGAERYGELLEQDGVSPAPYLARAFWIAVERWDVFRVAEWEGLLRASQELGYTRLSPRTQALLQLPKSELKRHVTEGRTAAAAKLLSEKTRKAKKVAES